MVLIRPLRVLYDLIVPPDCVAVSLCLCPIDTDCAAVPSPVALPVQRASLVARGWGLLAQMKHVTDELLHHQWC